MRFKTKKRDGEMDRRKNITVGHQEALASVLGRAGNRWSQNREMEFEKAKEKEAKP